MSASDPVFDPKDPEDLHRRSTQNLALLIRLAQAEGQTYCDGRSIEIDQASWYAIENLLRDARADLDCLWETIEALWQAPRPATRPSAAKEVGVQ